MKDIYEILNDIDVEEKEFVEIYASEEDKARIKLNLKKSITKKKLSGKKKTAAAAGIIFLIGCSIIAVKPALAKDLPIIGSLFNKELISVNKQYKNYIDIIGRTKSDKGIDVTFESAVADDNKLFLNFIVRNNNMEIRDDYQDALFIPESLKVNGEKLNTGAGASWEFIDNNTVRVLKEIDWSEYKKKNKMNIDIGIDELYGEKGNWGISFFADKSKLVQKTVRYQVNKSIEINGRKGKIDTVTISPLTVFIKGTEAAGTYREGQFMDFIVLDDKGCGLTWDGSSREGSENPSSKNPGKWTIDFINTENSKSVTIIPLCRTGQKPNELPAVKLDIATAARPLVLTIDNDRSVKIKDYFVEGDYLVIKYVRQYNGREDLSNFVDKLMYLTADGIKLEQATDEMSSKLLKKYDNDNHPICVYKIGSARDIMVGTYDGSNLMIMKDKSITVTTK